MLVVGIQKTEKTTGGIIIGDTVKEKPQEGKVVAVGPEKWDENGCPGNQKDDRVLFGNYAGNGIKIDGVEQFIMTKDDVPGIIVK